MPAPFSFLSVRVFVATLAVFGAAILFCFDPSGYSFFPICVFHQTTGLLCPGCGSLRALHQLLHGHLLIAFRFNPLLLLSLPVAGWYAARYLSSTLWSFRAAEGAFKGPASFRGKVKEVRPSLGAAIAESQRPRCSAAHSEPCMAAPEDGRTPLPLWFWLFLAAALAFTVWRNLPSFPIPLPPS